MKMQGSEQTLVVLANAGELVSAIANEVMGNEVADSFAGSPLTRGIVYNMAQTQFKSTVSKYLGGA
jgi:hypothetical protein